MSRSPDSAHSPPSPSLTPTLPSSLSPPCVARRKSILEEYCEISSLLTEEVVRVHQEISAAVQQIDPLAEYQQFIDAYRSAGGATTARFPSPPKHTVHVVTVRPSVCLHVHPSLCLSHCLSDYPSIHLSVCLTDHLSVHLSIYPYIRLSISMSVCLSVSLSVRPSVSVSLSFRPSVSPSVCLSVYLSTSVSVCLSICLPA